MKPLVNTLQFSLSAIALVFLLFIALLFHQGNGLKQFSDEINRHWIPQLIAINAIETATSDYRSALAEHVITDDPADMEENERKMRRFLDDISDWQNQYAQNIRPDQDRPLYERYLQAHQTYLEGGKLVASLSWNNDDQASRQFRHNRPAYTVLSDRLDALVRFNTEGSRATATANALTFSRVSHLILVGSITILLSGLGLLWLLWQRVHHNIPDLQTAGRVKRRLSGLFLAILTGLGCFSGLFYWQFTGASQQIEVLTRQWIPKIVTLNAINTRLSAYRVTEALYVLSLREAVSEIAQLDQRMKSLASDLDALRKTSETLLEGDTERGLYQSFSNGFDDYIKVSRQTLDFSRTRDSRKVGLPFRLSGILFADFRSGLQDLIKLNQQAVFVQSHTIDASLKSLKVITLGGASVILLGLGISLRLLRSWVVDPGSTDPAFAHPKTLFTIKTKLRLAFLWMVFTFMLFGFLINTTLDTMNQQTERLEKDYMPSILLINTISNLINDFRIAESQHLLVTGETDTLLWDKKLGRVKEKLKNAQDRYEKLISSEHEQQIYRSFYGKYQEYGVLSEQMLFQSRSNKDNEARQHFLHSRIVFESLNQDLHKLVELNSRAGIELTHLNNTAFSEARQFVFAVILAIFMLALLFMVVFDYNISRALQVLTGWMRGLAEGCLADADAEEDINNRADEIGQMGQALAVVTRTLKNLSGDALELIDATRAGVLSTRVDALRHPGEYGKIVDGMNALIDSLSAPLKEVSQIMQGLAMGDLDGRMQGDYQGELYLLKVNVNRSLDALVNLLNELGSILHNLSEADLTRFLQGGYHGEFSVLKANTNKTIARLIELLGEITQGTAQSAVAITQTSDAARYVAGESSRQMLAIEQVSLTLQETAVSVHEVAERAREGSELADATALSARQGQTQLARLIELIQLTDAEYGKIEQITDEITRIADKTHLLSLNAGLEAMRAGESGNGFGFLAQQIGRLAEEVSTSARHIGEVIDGSAQKIRLSVHVTRETQTAMTGIAEAAGISQQNAQAISVAIVQQSAAMTSLSERVSHIRQGSEATASASEQISATMHHLAQTVRNTADQAAQFKL